MVQSPPSPPPPLLFILVLPLTSSSFVFSTFSSQLLPQPPSFSLFLLVVLSLKLMRVDTEDVEIQLVIHFSSNLRSWPQSDLLKRFVSGLSLSVLKQF